MKIVKELPWERRRFGQIQRSQFSMNCQWIINESRWISAWNSAEIVTGLQKIPRQFVNFKSAATAHTSRHPNWEISIQNLYRKFLPEITFGFMEAQLRTPLNTFRFLTKWISIWFKIETKTVIMIISQSMWKKWKYSFLSVRDLYTLFVSDSCVPTYVKHNDIFRVLRRTSSWQLSRHVPLPYIANTTNILTHILIKFISKIQ